MAKNTKRIGCLGLLSRALLAILGLLLITSLVGTVVRTNLRTRYPPIGQMVDVGDFRMHIACSGSKSPTVIIEAGQGGMGLQYTNIQAALARDTRVCVYDRAGLGWSDMGQKPRSAQAVVDELHTLLNNAGEEGPYVLVGHSLGGLFSLLYANTYPSDVVGLILLDSPHMDRYTRAPQKEIDSLRSIGKSMPVIYSVMTGITLTGIPALLPILPVDTSSVPPEMVETYSALLKSSVRIIQGTSAELSALENYYQQVQSAQITSLGEIPVIAITHTIPGGYMNFTPEEVTASEEAWRQFQNELASLSINGKVIEANDSGHNIHIDRPDLVLQSIREVLQNTMVMQK